MEKSEKVFCDECEYWLDEAVPNDAGECHFWPPSNTGNPALISYFTRTKRSDYCYQGKKKSKKLLNG